MEKMVKIWLIIALVAIILALIYILWPKAINENGEVINNKNISFVNLQQEKPEITLLFGGDVMLSRYVYDKTIKTGSDSYPFDKIYDKFSEADIAFLNLEAPFKKTGPYKVTTGEMVFKVDPQLISGLTKAGIDIVSLANNHALNAGVTGLEYTQELLKQNNIEYCGTHNIAYLEKNETEFAFICYTYSPSPSSSLSYIDDALLINDLKKAEQNADIIIVSMHAGTEYVVKPTMQQTNFAHTAIDNGADLVIGHHPHETQIVEEYKGKYIFYSLGNLIFDQAWNPDAMKGMTVKATCHKNEIINLEIIPVQLEENCCPRWMDQEESQYILNRLNINNLIIK